MALSAIGVPVLLGGVLFLAVLAAVLLMRALPRRQAPSPEEREEMASAPMPGLQKRAWWGLTIGVVVLAILTAILATKGATAYWEDDDLRLLGAGIFLGGLAGARRGATAVRPEGVRAGRRGRERPGHPQSRADGSVAGGSHHPRGMARGAHEDVPRPGCGPGRLSLLMFGSVIIVNMIGHSLGILLGYWIVSRYGKS